MERKVNIMDEILVISGVFLCFFTFTLYNLYLYPWNSSLNLTLDILLFWFGYVVYEINHDVYFKRQNVVKKENVGESTYEGTSEGLRENTWEVV